MCFRFSWVRVCDCVLTINLYLFVFQVRLGSGMTEESEFSHWNQVLQNPDKEFTSWHVLMEPDNNKKK